MYKLLADGLDNNGVRVLCDYFWAMGPWAHTEFNTEEEAQNAIDDLKSNMPDELVEAEVEYYIVRG